jgi:hypothetical protein
MDYLKRKAQNFDFLDAIDFKVKRCASKRQRKLIKGIYRTFKRSTKIIVRKEINNELNDLNV